MSDIDLQVLKIEWGRGVRLRRKAQGLSADRLARLADVTTSYIGRIELGIDSPRDMVRIRLAAALGTTVEELFPYPAPTAADLVAS
jgi:transcriptional regulator with XRE-family HTH domain